MVPGFTSLRLVIELSMRLCPSQPENQEGGCNIVEGGDTPREDQAKMLEQIMKTSVLFFPSALPSDDDPPVVPIVARFDYPGTCSLRIVLEFSFMV